MLVSKTRSSIGWKPLTENHERPLEVQPGEKPVTLLYNQAQKIEKLFLCAIPRAFSKKSVNWNKIQASTQKSDEFVHDNSNWLHMNWDIYLLVK